MKALMSWLLLVVTNLLLPVGLLLFAKGFFPYKPFLPGLAEFDGGVSSAPKMFDRVVFMVIDALRSDFVFSEESGFGFTQSLISSGSAIPFTAHADSPTITMPRVKGLTTGSVPGFLDVILNFAESESAVTLASQDSWLAQLVNRGGRLVMYGDDTWAKLFPGMFTRSDPTSSFFVSDFTEVDNNVTRHIDDELQRDDWEGMIMHYLGVDHIGHKAGPKSPNMIPKQQEMDGIVKRIFTAIEEREHLKNTLFVLAGDHGMNDAGNHGGSGLGETSPALVFMSPKFKKSFSGTKCPAKFREGFDYYRTVEQNDFVPSLAGLLGFPVPRNNLGVLIPSLLHMWNVEDRISLALANAKQLLTIVKVAHTNFDSRNVGSIDCIDVGDDVDELACLWNESISSQYFTEGKENPEVALASLLKFSAKCQDVLSSASSNYDLTLMATGIAFVLLGLLCSLIGLVPILERSRLANLMFFATTAAYVVMMFASSYVEEEHNFWYWVASGWLFLLFLKVNGDGFRILLIIPMLRIARRWNQTGQKHAGASDITKDFLPEKVNLLWFLVLFTYTDMFGRIVKNTFRNIPGRAAGFIFGFSTIGAALTFKLCFAAQDTPDLIADWLKPLVLYTEELDMSLISLARTTFISLGTIILYTILFETRRKGPNATHTISTILLTLLPIFLATQTKLLNIPLLYLLTLTIRLLSSSSSSLTSTDLTLSTLILSHFTFFAYGGANAISSVDLSNSYNGVSGYSIAIVAFLTFVSNWIGPIYCSFAATVAITATARKREDGMGLIRHLMCLSLFCCAATGAVMLACTVLRTHLFIWTVFSPKYLFAMVWVVWHLGVNLLLGGVLVLAGRVGLE
ncbi:alkaline-phosphatase-like protein [Tuber brumale]|nr:alkaline-phosphatase-like protein [Tuber brumale]